MYIQTSAPYNPTSEAAAKIGAVSGNEVAQRPQQITWKPYLTSSPSRTPTVVTKDLAVWNPMEYPFDRYHGLNSYLLLQYFVLKFVDVVFHSLLFLSKFNFAFIVYSTATNHLSVVF